MNILVTGSNSPLGSFLIKRLLETSEDSLIFALSRSGLDIKSPRVKVIPFDIEEDKFNLKEQFNLVIHAAACVPNTSKSDSNLFDVNVNGSLELFKKIKFKTNSLIFNISSSSVYDDPSKRVLVETSKKTKENIYGLSKLEFENALEQLYKNSSVNLLTVRLPVVLVKGVKNNFISGWLKSIKEKKPVSLFNSESLFNACIYAEDIFTFLCIYQKKPLNKNLVCNLSSNRPIKIKDTAKLLSDVLSSDFSFVEKETSQPAQLISNDLASLNGFEPRSVKDAIKIFGKVSDS